MLRAKEKNTKKPVSYFLIWTGAFFLVHNTIVNYCHYQMTGDIVSQMDASEQANILLRQHFIFFVFPVIIASTLLVYHILAKPWYNFIELLTLGLYGARTYFMMSLISDFMLWFIFNVNLLTAGVFLWQTILSSLYNFWFSFDFFKRFHLRLFWLRLISVSILVAFSGWIIMFYLPMLWLYFTMH